MKPLNMSWVRQAKQIGQPWEECVDGYPASVQELLDQYGAVLIRGLHHPSPTRFENFIGGVLGDPMAYVDRTTPRRVIEGKVYSSTETPKYFDIALHSESTFAHTWPRWVCFLCVTPARSKGRTPIADVQKVYTRLPFSLRERFEETGILYLRNFCEGPGMNWQTAFQVSSKDELEAKCRQEDIAWEWRGMNHLRTWQRRPSMVWHPLSGIPAWFNQASALHVSALPQPLRDVLVRQLGDHDLPHQTFYGNREPIEQETIETIRQAFAEETLRFSWKIGDLLILDNLVFAHGREPFEGPRKTLACLAGPTSWADVKHSRVALG